MYYSIPGVHKAELLNKDVDYSEIIALANADAQQQPTAKQQENSRTETDAEAEAKVKVSRSSRISFECHASVLMADMFDDDDFDEDEMGNGDDDYLQDILSLFKMTSLKQH